jgi:hypothetical protein
MSVAEWSTPANYPNYQSIGTVESDRDNIFLSSQQPQQSRKEFANETSSHIKHYHKVEVFDVEQAKVHAVKKKSEKKNGNQRQIVSFAARSTNKKEDDRLLQADDMRQRRRDICWQRRLSLEGYFWLLGGLIAAVGALLFVLNSFFCFLRVPSVTVD